MKQLRKSSKSLLTALAVLITLGLSTAIAQDATPKDGGVLRVGIINNAATLDPIRYTGVYEGWPISHIADTLIVYDKEMSSFLPALATDWTVSDDGLVHTFTLRDDVHFQPGAYQDGRLMTPEDVKFSLERSANESALDRLSGVEEVVVSGEHEVELHLAAPNAALLAMLTNAGNVIVPWEEVEGWGDDFGSHLVGTGPFQIDQWRKDQELRLVRHEGYWGERPHLDGLTFKFILEPNMLLNALRTGEVDIANGISGQNLELVRQDSSLELLSKPSLSTFYVDLNNVEGPTADKRVREAIAMAIDVEEIVQGVDRWGGAAGSYLPVPPLSWGYDEELLELVPPHDPVAAKELLAEAGYPDGFKTELYLIETRVGYGTVLQAQLKQNLNIDVEIRVVEWGTYSSIVANGNAPMNMGGWTWYPDPYFYLNPLFHSNQIGALGNGKGYDNPEVDALLNRAATETTDQDVRAEYYKDALRLILADVPRLEIGVTDAIAAIRPNVHGFDVSPDSSVFIVNANGTNVWLD